jgi:hypothetical protein
MDSNGMSTVSKTEYFTEDCSGLGSVVAVYNETDMTEGELGYFECGGSDTYARIRLSLDSDCESAVVIYAALGACANMAANSQLNFFCSADEAIVQIFTMQMSSTFLPSSTALLFNTTSLPTEFNETFLPTDFNETLFPTGFNATLATLFNVTTLPTELNATLPTMTTMFNATMPSIINISTSQIEMMMCQDDEFCDKWIISRQCNLLTTVSLGFSQGVYGIFEECGTGMDMSSSTTMLTEFNTTFDDNITATEPTASSSTSTSTSTSTTRGTETTSGAIRPSLLFTAGMFFSFFFLVSV